MSLNSTKDFYSFLIEALNYLKINKGNLIESSSQNLNKDIINEDNKVISYKIRYYLNLLTKHNFNLSTSYYDFFQFKKSNKYLFKMEKATELLKLAFLAKGCLISKPIFNILYPQINILEEENEINLSELKKTNKNKNFYKKIIKNN